NLPLLNLVTLFNPDPLYSTGDLRIHVDLVMGNDVAACGQDYTPGVTSTFRCRSNYLHFRCIGREHAIGEGDNAEQHDNPNTSENVSLCPNWGLAFPARSMRTVDFEVLKVFVLGIDRHTIRNVLRN